MTASGSALEIMGAKTAALALNYLGLGADAQDLISWLLSRDRRENGTKFIGPNVTPFLPASALTPKATGNGGGTPNARSGAGPAPSTATPYLQ